MTTDSSSNLRRIGSAILPLLVLAAGGVVAWYLMQSRPQAARKPAPRQARLVDTAMARHASYRIVVEAQGAVVPARRVDINPQVAGALVDVSPELEPGGRFAAGDVLAVVDPRDYELAIRQREAELAEAEAQLAVEMGNQEVARRESEILGDLVSEGRMDLVLRKPQLETAKARVAVARAALDVARLDLERTRVTAPFDAVVEARNVVLGSRVDATTTIATLVGTDEYRVEVTVPARDLRWLEIPHGADGTGSLARVADDSAWPAGTHRRGAVVRRLVDLEPEGRLARLLVAVPDPLALSLENADEPTLLLGAFVNVAMVGKSIEGVVLDRAYLRDGDAVWLVDNDNTLEIRSVEVAYRGPREVVIAGGLREGERIVASDLSTPVAGMPLRVSDRERHGAMDG